ncbi:MAG: hypothetical protein E6G62_10645, partial [Actinobacteria bacterium]
MTFSVTGKLKPAFTSNSNGLVITAGSGVGGGAAGNRFDAEATSGAGGGTVGVAGSLALDIVNLHTGAILATSLARGPPHVDSGSSDATLSATSNSSSTAKALPATGTTGSSVGIGASVALNIVNDETLVSVADGATLTGANISLTSDSTDAMTTQATTGASSPSVAVTPAVAVAISNVTTKVEKNPGPIGAPASLTLHATQHASAATTASGSADGGTAAVGASVAITVANHDVEATTGDVSIPGALSIEADGTSSTTTSAT